MYNLSLDFKEREMESEIFKICACAVLCGVVGMVVGGYAGSLSAGIRIAGLVLVLGGMLGALGTVVDLVRDLGIDEDAAHYSSIMLRGLGIAVLCRVCSDICRDCGESTVAFAVESAGKLGSIVLAAPAVLDIVEIAGSISDKL